MIPCRDVRSLFGLFASLQNLKNVRDGVEYPRLLLFTTAAFNALDLLKSSYAFYTLEVSTSRPITSVILPTYRLQDT